MKHFLLYGFLFLVGIGPVFRSNGQCKTPLGATEFEQYKQAIQAESFSTNQMEVAQMGAQCLSTAQIKAVMDLFGFESMKLDFAKWAYTRCSDKSSYFMVNSAFGFSSSKTELNNYIKSLQTSQNPKQEEPATEPEPLPPPAPRKTLPKKLVVEPRQEEPQTVPDRVMVSEIDKDIPLLKNANKDAIAVVIGNCKYLKAKHVAFALKDARSVKNYLIRVCGYKEGNIIYLEDATLGEMNTVFGTKENPRGRLANAIKAGLSDVVVYYAGHGAPGLKDSKAYLVPVEADPNYIENSGYSVDILYDNLKKIPARSVVVFTDACFSGADVFDKISPMVLRAKEPSKEGLKNTTIINSCSGSEVSCWHNEEEHGLFTFYLLKAMKDYAATDSNKDRQISLAEIFASLSDNNEAVPYYARRQYGLTQTPVIQGSKTKILFKY